MKRIPHPILVFTLLSLAVLHACRQPTAPPPSRNAPDDTASLRIACVPTLDCLPLYYAVESGICDSLQLPLCIKTYQAQLDADTALMGKTVDAAFIDVVRLVHYRSTNRMKNVAKFLPTDGRWQLVADRQLRIGSLGKLKGRTVAVARHAISERWLQQIEDSLRWSVDDIFTPQINSYRVRFRMLENRQIDAAILPEPFATRAIVQGQRSLAAISSSRFEAGIYVKHTALTHRRKRAQLDLLKQAYAVAVRHLNAHSAGTLRTPHRRLPEVDSVLVRRYQLPPSVLDTLRLPHYRLPAPSSRL